MGTKAGMTSIFSDDGKMTPCTVVGLKSGCFVTHIKTVETDGYNAVQVGYDEKRESLLTKPELGHLKKNGCPPLRHLAEFKLEQIPEGSRSGRSSTRPRCSPLATRSTSRERAWARASREGSRGTASAG